MGETETTAADATQAGADETKTGAADATGAGDTTPAGAGDTPAGDSTKDSDATGAAPGADAAQDDAAKPPERYALVVPEGATMAAADLAALEALARRQGWSNDQAQAALEAQVEALDAHAAALLEATQADPVYGGEHLAETQRRAVAALDRIRPRGTPRGDAFRALLDKTGYGNHVEVLAFLADLGSLMDEDQPGPQRSSGGGTPEAPDPVAVLYGQH
jgi:hypothetical protein